MINENNYETFFMSYIDNELNATERAAVEAFVLTDSKYTEELALFEKTKVHTPSTESIEMEDKIFLYRFPEMQASLDTNFKKSLYKKEAPIRKIVFTPNLMRASFTIAALLILFIGIQLFKTNTAIKEKASVVSTNNASTHSKQTENTILPSKELDASLKNSNAAIVSSQPVNKKINLINISVIEPSTNSVIDIEKHSASNLINSNIINAEESQSALLVKLHETQIRSSAMETVSNEEVKNTPVILSSYQEINTEQEDRTINIGMLEIDGAAFRGITRRVSALLKRNKIEKEK
jgi:hypothetical protein